MAPLQKRALYNLVIGVVGTSLNLQGRRSDTSWFPIPYGHFYDYGEYAGTVPYYVDLLLERGKAVSHDEF